MSIRILESKFCIENSEIITRDIHNDIRNSIMSRVPELESHIDSLEKTVALLKENGFEIIYSLKLDTRIFKK